MRGGRADRPRLASTFASTARTRSTEQASFQPRERFDPIGSPYIRFEVETAEGAVVYKLQPSANTPQNALLDVVPCSTKLIDAGTYLVWCGDAGHNGAARLKGT